MTNPYSPPTTEPAHRTERSDVRKRVSRPATALIIMSSIHAVFVVIHLVTAAIVYFHRIGSGISFLVTGLAVAQLIGSILITVGAAKLGFLESYRMARIGSILACIPFVTPFIWLGVPFGVWALRLLSDLEVRRAFPGGFTHDGRLENP